MFGILAQSMFVATRMPPYATKTHAEERRFVLNAEIEAKPLEQQKKPGPCNHPPVRGSLTRLAAFIRHLARF